MAFYPFDDQRCTMELETWVYTSDKVNLTNVCTEVDLNNYVPHGEWDIIKTRIVSTNKVSKDAAHCFLSFLLTCLQLVSSKIRYSKLNVAS